MRRASWLLLAGALCGCGVVGRTANPCTACPDVAGSYSEKLEAALANRSACGELSSEGGTDTIEVSQPDGGSVLSIQSGLSNTAIPATLNDDSSITVADGVPAVSGDGHPGTLTLSGRFFFGTGRTFEGTYGLTLSDRSCVDSNNQTHSESLSIKTNWTAIQ